MQWLRASAGMFESRKKYSIEFQDNEKVLETIDSFGDKIARPMCTWP